MKGNVIRIEHANPEHKHWLCVNWCMSNICNYQCSYCPDGLHNRSNKWYSRETVQNFCSVILDYCDANKKKVFFEFTGGEITLWKDLLVLCAFLKSRAARVGIISNGSRKLDWWEKAAPLLDRLCLSFHPEYADADHLARIIDIVKPHALINVNIMMLPAKFEYCLETAQRLSKIENITVSLQPLIKDLETELYEYTPQQQQQLSDQTHISQNFRFTREYEGFRGDMARVNSLGLRTTQPNFAFIARQENNWKGWRCYAGVEQIVVDMNGSVYRGWCKVGGAIGHVADQAFRFEPSPVICNKTFCHCNYDIMCTKERGRLSPGSEVIYSTMMLLERGKRA